MTNFLKVILLSVALLFHVCSAKDKIETLKPESRQARQHPFWPFALNVPFFYKFPFYPYHYYPYPVRDLTTPAQFNTNDVFPEKLEEETEPRKIGSYFSWNGKHADPISETGDEPISRQNPFGLSNINSAVDPVAYFLNQVPKLLIFNPNADGFLRRFASCIDPAGSSGICVTDGTCRSYGGRVSGVCPQGVAVCCINAINKCGGQTSLNNTYWQSPRSVSSDSSCSLTVTLDTNLAEQVKKPVCQLRLDFLTFQIAQPGADSVCSTDNFVVGGATNRVPTLCGDNPGQHMYLDVPSSTTGVQLLFTFGQSTTSRSWNILVSMIPCGSDGLAPKGCLQYFFKAVGSVKSFNWKDTAPTETRQLANQDYSICFRNEKIDNKDAVKICYTPCTVSNQGLSFNLNSAAALGLSSVGTTACPDDYLIIPNGSDTLDATLIADRYCGEQFNPTANSDVAATVCNDAESFRILYRTDGAETIDTSNQGFCLNYQEFN